MRHVISRFALDALLTRAATAPRDGGDDDDGYGEADDGGEEGEGGEGRSAAAVPTPVTRVMPQKETETLLDLASAASSDAAQELKLLRDEAGREMMTCRRKDGLP